MMPFVPPILSSVGITYGLGALTDPANDRDSFALTYSVTFHFRDTLTGTVDLVRGQSLNFVPDDTYVAPALGGTFYVRCTQNSGTALNVGDTLGAWLSLTSVQERSFGLQYTTSGGPDLVSANIDFDLATDSGGSNIVASQSGIDIEVGQTI